MALCWFEYGIRTGGVPLWEEYMFANQSSAAKECLSSLGKDSGDGIPHITFVRVGSRGLKGFASGAPGSHPYPTMDKDGTLTSPSLPMASH